MAKHIKVKPSKAQSKFGMIAGLIFCMIGCFVVIPVFGPFGIFWTTAAAWITYTHYKNGFTEEGIPTKEIIIEDSNDIECRLKQLDDLYRKGMISTDEYQSKRKEILNDL